MTNEDPKPLVRRFYTAIEAQDRNALVDDLLTPDFVLHFDRYDPMIGVQAIAYLLDYASAFPDLVHEIEDQFATGDRVATRLTWRGTNSSSFQGMLPTNKVIAVGAIAIHRTEADRIAEYRIRSNELDLMLQLDQFGVLAFPEPPTA